MAKTHRPWLPEDKRQLWHTDFEAETGFDTESYAEFDTLIHATTLEDAGQILANGFTPTPVCDDSEMCAPDHPLKGHPVTFFGPDTIERLRTPGESLVRYAVVNHGQLY